MCGIVGLYLKNPRLEPQLGQLFEPMLQAMTDRGPDSAGFAIYGDEVADGGRELRVGDPVRAAGDRGRKAALNLVGTLGAGLESLQSMGDGEVDTAIVAEFEVQMRIDATAAPVAPK